MKIHTVNIYKFLFESWVIFVMVLLLSLALVSTVFAADPASAVKKNQTTLGLYYKPVEMNHSMLKHVIRS